MKRVALYSSSSRSAVIPRSGGSKSRERVDSRRDGSDQPEEHPPERSQDSVPRGWRRFYRRRMASAWAVAAAFVVAILLGLRLTLAPAPHPLTQKQIDAAVLHTLATKTLPSPAARAYGIIEPSVVRVRGFAHTKGGKDLKETSVGSGVVIIDNGVILTSLHVVAGAERVSVVFADGTESEASVLVREPDRDLAVLVARTLPDDLVAATLRSTKDLAPGDRVIAVGFPFDIGPSVTAGVVSGLRRERRSMSGEHMIGNLIQFDAAVNPGSSGGPLVTADGEVVGIVTSILNPRNENVFVGIGFAVPIEDAAAAAGMTPF